MSGAGRLPAVVAVIIIAALLLSCDAPGMTPAGGAGADASGGEDYDFSVFFGHAEDPIKVGRIVLRYEAETGVSIRPIMTEAGAPDDRLLRRYLDASDPPAAFAAPSALLADADTGSDYVGIDWRFHGRGLAADRRTLADLIGAQEPSAPEVDEFIENIRLAGYGEWSSFIAALSAYINGREYETVKLNDREYHFAGEKGRYSSRLNGVFAVSGSDTLFMGEMLMDMASVTSETDALARSRVYTTPQAMTMISPVINTYVEALGVYTSDIAGMYASGVRGDDFINSDIYSPDYTGSVFAEQRAVFMPFDSVEYAQSPVADATQTEYIAILPVKMPYSEFWLSGYVGGVGANRSLRMNTEYSLCVNPRAGADVAAKADAFVSWLASDAESTDAVQLCLKSYYESRSFLPIPSDAERDEAGGVYTFGRDASAKVAAPMLSDPDWREDEIVSLRESLFEAWLDAD
jgi:hypothetical protein